MIRIPSKTFLLGEYGILHGTNALLLGHGPWFTAEYGGSENPFHPQSPAGKFLAGRNAGISFTDPHGGRGGFGGSGAEFVAAFCVGRTPPVTPVERQAFAWQAWNANRGNPGSGADVVTQAWGIDYGKDFFLSLDLTNRELEAVVPSFGGELSLFHTGKKVATHTHLKELQILPIDQLDDIVSEGMEALRGRSAVKFGAALTAYGEILAERGLLAPHSSAALASLPRRGVLGAKGCGAMGADVIAVLHEGAELEGWARENSLSLVLRLPV